MTGNGKKMEKTKKDLSKFKRVSKDRVDPEATKTMVSIRLENHVIAGLKDEAERTGVPYQTLLSSILHMYLTGQLVDRKKIFSSISEIANSGLEVEAKAKASSQAG